MRGLKVKGVGPCGIGGRAGQKLKGVIGVKTKVTKVFMNYEKEEDWLNKMSSKGLALTRFFFMRYTFEDCEPGEYIYRIELLDHVPWNPKSRKYIDFMEDNGVEFVDSYVRWVYFRKKATDGPFDIYSDIDSKMAHYKRVATLWFVLACAEIGVGLPNVAIWMEWLGNGDDGTILNLIGGLVLLFFSAVFFTQWNIMRKKIKRLKEEKGLRE